MRHNLVKLSDQLNSENVKWDLCTVGSIVMDNYYLTEAMPVAGGEVNARFHANYHGGACGNVAAYSAYTYNLNTVILSNVGNDPVGSDLIQQLETCNVTTQFVIRQKSTGKITLVTDNNGQRMFIVYLPEREKSPIIPEVMEECRVVYIAPCEPDLAEQAILTAKNQKKPVFFNPGSAFYNDHGVDILRHLLRQTDVLFVNKDEAIYYSGYEEPATVANFFLETGLSILVITDAANGSIVFTSNNVFHQPAYQVDVHDPLGPGDAYASGFIAEFLRSQDTHRAALQGSRIGAFVVTQSGVREVVPSLPTLDSFCNQLDFRSYPLIDLPWSWPSSEPSDERKAILPESNASKGPS